MAEKKRALETIVRLDSIDIESYRSCRGTRFAPNDGLSALIGVNGAGKTNILQSIRLLDYKRGRAARRRRDSTPNKAGNVEITTWFRVNEERVGLRITFSALESDRRGDEMVAIKELWNLSALGGPKGWYPMPPAAVLQGLDRNPAQGKRFYYIGEGFEFLPDQLFEDVSIVKNRPAVEALTSIERFRAGISYYSASQFTDPARCPNSFEVDEEDRLNELYLSSSRTSHVQFLYDLYRLRRENVELYNQYCQFVSRQQLGLISRLTWKEIELSTSTAEVRSGGNVRKINKRKTLVIPKIQIGSSYITFNQLSEGTFKTLALVFYIVTDSSKFLMIEEPEVCVHHGLLKRIVETIKAYSVHKQIVISTHSDLLVDELEPNNLFVVEMTSNGTAVKSLEAWLDKREKQALHKYLEESGPLGEYWRLGGLHSGH